MGNKKIKVYFLGAGDIAVPVLSRLVNETDIDVVGAGTQVDRPAGRKRKLTPTPVGIWAEQNEFSINKIANVNTDKFKDELKGLKPDVVLVVSFGQIIKKELLDLDNIVWVNVHASLLPAYRGASPITSAILNRDTKTGVTYMEMDEGLDTGPIYCSYELPLNGDEKADSLELRLGEFSADSVADVIKSITSGEFQPVAQDESLASLTRKIKKEYGVVDWNDTAEVIEAKTRAFYPWPGAVFSMENIGKDIKIRIVDAVVHKDLTGVAGEVIKADKKRWIVACGKSALELKRVVPQGKKEMGGADFLRGHQIKEGSVL